MKNFKIAAEVYSRVSGYFRPVVQWNNGKQAEFADRKPLKFDNNRVKDTNSKLKTK